MDHPFFSIVVLVYKVETFLRQCLDSLLNQIFTDFEVIVVDDGSPDRCPLICDEYAAKDSRFVVIHQENGGIAKARKAAAAAVRGRFMGAVDGDDWVEPDYLAEAYDKLSAYDADILQFDTYYNLPKEVRLGTFLLPEGCFDTIRFNEFILGPYRQPNMSRHGIVGSSMCIKFIRSKLLVPEILALEDDFIFGEDAACVFLCLAKSKSFCYHKKPLYHYRRRPGSSTHRYDHSGMEKNSRLWQHIAGRLAELGRPDLFRFADVVYLRLLLLHIFMLYAYSGYGIDKRGEIRSILRHRTTCTALSSFSVRSAKIRTSLLILMLKLKMPPMYALVKPNLPEDGLFVRKR